MEYEMTITEKFDRAKKLDEGGNLNSGYKTKSKKFDSYLTNEEWNRFKGQMPPCIQAKYEKNELEEYTKKGIHYPPRMASYASSSRFIYEMGKDIEGFTFEESLKTGLGGYPAKIDGYLASKNLYIEAKCHEFYSHSKPELRKGHKDLYDGIIPLLSPLSLNFSYEPKEIGQSVSLNFDGDIHNFDLKQMICHLCGIANKVLREGLQKVNFIYLIYKPTKELLDKISSEEDRKAIQNLFDKEIKTAKRIPFNHLYCAILKYFNRKKQMYTDAELDLFSNESNFRFQVCDQTNFNDAVDKL